MTPPQLPGDAPIVHIVDPGEPPRFQALGVDDDIATAHGVAGGLGQGIDLDPPLQAQPRLDRFAAAFRMPDAVHIRPLLGDDAALGRQRLADLDPGLEPVHPIELSSGARDVAAGVHDRRHRQVVPHPDLEVVGVMSGSDFDCAGAEFGIDVGIGDHDDLAVLKRVRQRGAHEMPVAVVVGVHGDGGVTQHGLDAGGRHHDVRFGVLQRAVPEGHQFAVDLLVSHLEIGDGGLQHRGPVDQALGPVDQPGIEEPLEDGSHRPGQAFVHGEPVAAPVDTVAEAAHLGTDGAAGLVLPVPDLGDELLAAEVFLGPSGGGELAFDQRLGGDAGVIHAGQPQHLEALHALTPGQSVHQGVIESVTHVQAAGDVGRRKHDRVRRLVAGGVGREVARVDPALVDLALYRAGIPGLR